MPPKEPGKIVLEDGTPVIVPKESPTLEPSENACKCQLTTDMSISCTVRVPPEYVEKMREDMNKIRETLKRLPEIWG